MVSYPTLDWHELSNTNASADDVGGAESERRIFDSIDKAAESCDSVFAWSDYP